MYWRFSAKAGPPQNKRSSALTLTPPINAYMPQNWPLGKDSEEVKVKQHSFHLSSFYLGKNSFLNKAFLDKNLFCKSSLHLGKNSFHQSSFYFKLRACDYV